MKQLKAEDLMLYAFCDPGGDHRKKSEAALKKVRARSAIITIGVEPVLLRIFVIVAWAERCSTDVLADKLFSVFKQFPMIKQFGIEANAMQSQFAGMLQRESRMRGAKVPFVPIMQPTRIDKDFRIRSALQKPLSEGRIFVQNTQMELLTELRSFPTGQTKDLVDALASVVNMVPQRAVKAMLHEEEEATLKYLRESGAPTHVIEGRFPRLRTERMVEQLKRDFNDRKV